MLRQMPDRHLGIRWRGAQVGAPHRSGARTGGMIGGPRSCRSAGARSGPFNDGKRLEPRMAVDQQLARSAAAMAVAELLRAGPGGETFLAGPDRVRSEERIAFLRVLGAAQQLEFDE